MTKGFIIKFRKSILIKGIAIKMLLLFVFQLAAPNFSYALTSGPAQEEYTSFEPASTSDMVNLYSGSFVYNIPLLSVPGPNGGYPINLSYHSGVGMEDEASWVGLGWTLNTGAVNRQLQGIPDDINGENITYRMHQKNSFTIGLNADFLLQTVLNNDDLSAYYEEYGIEKTEIQYPGNHSYDYHLTYNNYNGLGYRVTNFSLGNNLSIGKSKFHVSDKLKKLNQFLGLSYDSHSGIGINPNLSHDLIFANNIKFGFGLTAAFNSRTGLNGINVLTRLGRNSSTSDDESENKGKSFMGSSSLSFSSKIGMPNTELPTRDFMVNLNMRFIGNTSSSILGEWETRFPKNWEGYVGYNYLKDNGNLSLPAYGYMYSNTNDDDIVSDYYRTSQAYSKKTSNLGPSRITHDVFNYTAQGAGGTFRPYHNAVLTYSDKKNTVKNKSVSIGIEYATETTNIIPHQHLGTDIGFGAGKVESGDWSTGLEVTEISRAKTYMKMYGEHSGLLVDEDKLSEWKDDEALRHKLTRTGGWLDNEYQITDEFLYYEGNTAVTTPDLTVNTIDRRSNFVKHLTEEEAQNFGYSRETSPGNSIIKYYNQSTSSWVSKSFAHNESHISEIQVTQPDGMKYVYALPAYNNSHKNVSMSVEDELNPNTFLVDIDDDSYESTDKRFLNESIYPEYAHSWLLTTIVSADYVDSDGIPGPTENDMGYWVKFNYKKVDDDYRWRIPYEGANYIDGNPGDANDNMASFTTGTKELYYTHSIETKTHIAIFYTTERKDAHEPDEEYAHQSASPGSGTMYKLDKISLFTKHEYYLNEECDSDDINTSAIPLKSVHFSYDYSLCDGVPNNNGSGTLVGNETANQGGKLTLNSVHFTSENSTRGELSPYRFTYSNNHDYEPLNMDRWGNYQENTSTYTNNDYPFVDFPYTEQPRAFNSSFSEPEVAQWTISSIKLPTGGVLDIEFESNEYAKVESQEAMRMFDIVGIGNDIDPTTQRILSSADLDYSDPDLISAALNAWSDFPYIGSAYTSLPVRDATTSAYTYLENQNTSLNGYRMFFELEEPIEYTATTAERNEVIVNNYVKEMTKLWFKNMTVLKYDVLTGLIKDYVSGYVNINRDLLANHADFGMCKKPDATSTDPFTIGYITLEQTQLQENGLGIVKCNPMTKLSLQHLKLARPDVANSLTVQDASPAGMTVNFITQLLGGAINDAMGMVLSYNLWAFTKGFGKYIELNGKSIVRLYDPNEKKFGAGARVKKMSLNDNWVNSEDDPIDGDYSVYGQEYIYTLDGTTNGASSGVAYEPQTGTEESALRQPIEYTEGTFLGSKYTLFQEKPIMEMYYPGPSVGYSKVTVKSIAPEQADYRDNGVADDNSTNINNTAAPVTVYEFYTPNDFPVYFDETDMNADKSLVRAVVIPGIYSDLRIKKARAQGYSIVTNDMAGKQKQVSTYKRESNGNIGTLLGSQTYIYQTKEEFNPNGINKLDNTVQVVSVDPVTNETFFQTGTLAQHVEIFHERNETRSSDFSAELQFNLELPHSVTPIAAFSLEIFLNISKSEMSFKDVVTHKIIHRGGILKKVITKSDQSIVETENMAYDIETGEALLTKVTNQYEDAVYSLSYPAYWYYPSMGPMHTNGDLTIVANGANPITLSNGEITGNYITSSIDQFNVGDEIFVKCSLVNYRFHISFIDESTNTIYCIDEDGASVTGPVSVDYIKMINSGYKNLQVAKSGGISFKELTDFDFDFTENPTEFLTDDILSANAIEYKDDWQSNCNCEEVNPIVNPFLNGIKSLWRAYKSHAYNTTRIYANNSRTDGIFADFVQFDWKDPSSSSTKWIQAAEITKYSPYSFELENKDALENYSAALYGYKNSLPIAVMSNSRYKEAFFESFEDYYGFICPTCIDDHFRIATSSGQLDATQFHTGKFSIKVTEGNEIVKRARTSSATNCDDNSNYETVIYKDPETETVYFTFQRRACDCQASFSLTPTKEYYLSGWIKDIVSGSTDIQTTYDGEIEVRYYNSGFSLISSEVISPVPNTNMIIEGWQQISGKITIPTTAEYVDIVLVNGGTVINSTTYFDDIRVVPFNGNMRSFVYDATTFKLVAELDENNYATIFVYDEAGQLIITKKETVKGIKTITEGRSFHAQE